MVALGHAAVLDGCMRSTTPHCRGNYGIVHYFVEDCISPWWAQRGDIAMAVWVSLRQKALVGWHRDSGFRIVPVGMTSAGQCHDGDLGIVLLVWL